MIPLALSFLLAVTAIIGADYYLAKKTRKWGSNYKG